MILIISISRSFGSGRWIFKTRVSEVYATISTKSTQLNIWTLWIIKSPPWDASFWAKLCSMAKTISSNLNWIITKSKMRGWPTWPSGWGRMKPSKNCLLITAGLLKKEPSTFNKSWLIFIANWEHWKWWETLLKMKELMKSSGPWVAVEIRSRNLTWLMFRWMCWGIRKISGIPLKKK